MGTSIDALCTKHRRAQLREDYQFSVNCSNGIRWASMREAKSSRDSRLVCTDTETSIIVNEKLPSSSYSVAVSEERHQVIESCAQGVFLLQSLAISSCP